MDTISVTRLGIFLNYKGDFNFNQAPQVIYKTMLCRNTSTKEDLKVVLDSLYDFIEKARKSDDAAETYPYWPHLLEVEVAAMTDTHRTLRFSVPLSSKMSVDYMLNSWFEKMTEGM